MEGGQTAVCIGNRVFHEGIWPRASGYLVQHLQPFIDINRSGAIKGGRGFEGSDYGVDQDCTWPPASFCLGKMAKIASIYRN